MNVDAVMANLKNARVVLDCCRENVEKPEFFAKDENWTKIIQIHNLCIDIRVALDKFNNAKSRSFAAARQAAHLDKKLKKKSKKKHEAGCDCMDCRPWTT